MSDLLQELKAAAQDARLSFEPEAEQALLAAVEKVKKKAAELRTQFDHAAESPLFSPPGAQGRMEEDRPGASLPREVALANGPDTGYTCFHVPRIVSE
jgi:Asp-tRNA(Asn)/Glu-tRNA(Gln) amidotransferase C subunit